MHKKKQPTQPKNVSYIRFWPKPITDMDDTHTAHGQTLRIAEQRYMNIIILTNEMFFLLLLLLLLKE